MDRKAGLRLTIDELFRNRGTKPTIAYEAEGCSSVITFVSLHYGISILPMVPGLAGSDVAFAKIGNPEFSRAVALAWKRERNLPPAVKRVRDFIVDNYALKREDPDS
jgi:DNA-binding transcriptional LysR family regulator